MIPTIKRVTPREIADMLINEEAYQSTFFVTAEDHDAEIANLVAEITNLRTEVLERARLLSVGAEREAKLRARVEVLERALHAAKDAMAAVSVPRDNERAILFQAYDAALVALEAKP